MACHVTSLLVGKTCNWLIEDNISGRVLCVILKQANAQYSAHPQTPLPTTKAGSMRGGTGITVDVSCEERSSNK